jgi:hypothetical protein
MFSPVDAEYQPEDHTVCARKKSGATGQIGRAAPGPGLCNARKPKIWSAGGRHQRCGATIDISELTLVLGNR